MGIVVGDAQRNLVHIELAEADSARALQFFYCHAVSLRYIIGPELRAMRRAHARGLVQVFEGDWNTVQRTAIIAATDLHFGRARLRQRGVGRERNETVEVRFNSLDALEVRARQLQRRKLPRGNQFGALGDREAGEFRHGEPSCQAVIAQRLICRSAVEGRDPWCQRCQRAMICSGVSPALRSALTMRSLR